MVKTKDKNRIGNFKHKKVRQYRSQGYRNFTKESQALKLQFSENLT